MNFKKITFLFLALFFLNNCVESTALLGPAITAGSTGNVYQTGFSYSSNYAIKKATGKSTGEHINNYLKLKKTKKNIN